MPLITALFPLFKLLYPLPEPNYTRDRPLEVLALGPSRSGTDSLRKALLDLGYGNVNHGFHLIEPSNQGEIPQFCRLILAKRYGDDAFLTTKEFDKVLGHCGAAADSHTAVLGDALIRAYPDAKVVLNRRGDVEKWHQSALSTVDAIYQVSWFKTWALFDAREFWTRMLLSTVWGTLFGENFAETGKEKYVQHFDRLEAILQKEGRPYLNWKVEDGWEPLCRFLGKPVPQDTPFPNGNPPAHFFEAYAEAQGRNAKNAKRNFVVFGAVVISTFAAVVAYLMTG